MADNESNFVKIDMDSVGTNQNVDGGINNPLSPESLSFVQTDSTGSPMKGQSQSYASSYFGNIGVPYSLGSSVSSNRVSGFLKQKGFGWMMEVEQDEDDADTSLLEELDIQPTKIANRIRSVLVPLPHGNERFDMNSPDFWGPLACVFAYAMISALGQFSVLPSVLVVWLSGSFVIFIVSRGLGAELTYSLCLGILGYSTLPLALVAIALPALTISEYSDENPFSPIAVFLKGVAMFWSTVSAMAAFGALITAGGLTSRRPLFAYPIFLFYGYLIALYSGV